MKFDSIPDVQILQAIKPQEHKNQIGTVSSIDFNLIPIFIHPDW